MSCVDFLFIFLEVQLSVGRSVSSLINHAALQELERPWKKQSKRMIAFVIRVMVSAECKNGLWFSKCEEVENLPTR
jgi:hypothetical protein